MKRRAFIGAAAGLIGGVPSPLLAEFYAPKRRDIGFIFIGASWCPYCHKAAPYLHRLAANDGIPVLVVSIDGRPIPPFTEFVHDPDHPLVGDSPRLPTTMLWDAQTDAVIGKFDGFKKASRYVSNLKRLVTLSVNQGDLG